MICTYCEHTFGVLYWCQRSCTKPSMTLLVSFKSQSTYMLRLPCSWDVLRVRVHIHFHMKFQEFPWLSMDFWVRIMCCIISYTSIIIYVMILFTCVIHLSTAITFSFWCTPLFVWVRHDLVGRRSASKQLSLPPVLPSKGPPPPHLLLSAHSATDCD